MVSLKSMFGSLLGQSEKTLSDADQARKDQLLAEAVSAMKGSLPANFVRASLTYTRGKVDAEGMVQNHVAYRAVLAKGGAEQPFAPSNPMFPFRALETLAGFAPEARPDWTVGVIEFTPSSVSLSFKD